jgi:ribosomal protein S18 acetylase RimI-like enzyme
MPGIEYVIGGVELLDAVGPLWEQLNEHHRLRSTYFADEYAQRTFGQRRALLLAKAQTATLRVDLARDTVTGRFVGYCISTVTQGQIGEIDSIYIETAYRRQGIGEAFMRRALAWMEREGAQAKQIVVAVGNEQALSFYEAHGFYPRHILLKKREEK